MKQISHNKKSFSYIYYLLLSSYIAAEPFVLKQIFATYLPDFYYRGLTVPISVVIGIIGIRKFKKVTGESLIRQVSANVYQVYVNFSNPKFRNRIFSNFQIDYKILLNLLKISHSSEPMFHIRLKEAVKYYRLISIFVGFLLAYVFYLFLINFSRWGVLDTSLTILFYLFIIGLIGMSLANLPIVINITKQLRNAKKSESDLEELLKILKEELKDWQFESRVLLPSNNSKLKRDIDVVAISPDNNHFVIELKSHEGKVLWNSKLKKLYQQHEKDPKLKPFKEDYFNQVNKQGKLLYNSRELSQFPGRFLVFWRAEVAINQKKRLQRGVKISERSCLIKDLKKCNKKLSEKACN